MPASIPRVAHLYEAPQGVFSQVLSQPERAAASPIPVSTNLATPNPATDMEPPGSPGTPDPAKIASRGEIPPIPKENATHSDGKNASESNGGKASTPIGAHAQEEEISQQGAAGGSAKTKRLEPVPGDTEPSQPQLTGDEANPAVASPPESEAEPGLANGGEPASHLEDAESLSTEPALADHALPAAIAAPSPENQSNQVNEPSYITLSSSAASGSETGTQHVSEIPHEAEAKGPKNTAEQVVSRSDKPSRDAGSDPLEVPFGAVIPPPPRDNPAFSSDPRQGKTGEFLGGPIATPQDLQSQLDAEIITTCNRLVNQGYGLYGLFGRPSTGKSSLVYALRHHFIKGDPGFGGYAPDGENWDELARDLESQWNDRQIPTNADRPHTYLAQSPRGKEHIAIMDIAGERFEGVQSWTDEVFEFFGLYLGYCKGFFVLVELDDLASAGQVGHDASARIQSQMARIVRFLAVAAQMEKLRDLKDVKAKRAAAEEAVVQTGKVKVKVPVALCLSKADTVGRMKFGPELGRVVPGSTSPQSDPWNVLQAVWPEHVASLLNMVPKLKVDWLSCLGTEFETQRSFSGSVGLRGAFQHVISQPPPKWALSTKRYLGLQKMLRL